MATRKKATSGTGNGPAGDSRAQVTSPTPSPITLPVKACERCPDLVKSRACIINGRGQERPSFMIVGDMPSWDDNEAGKAYAGKHGKVLAQLFKEAGVDPLDTYLTFAVRCYSKGGARAAHMKACREYLLEEIRRVNPKVILACGREALAALYKRLPISDVAGQTLIQPDTGIPLIATFAPGYLMQRKSGTKTNWGEAGKMIAHIEKAARIVANGIGRMTLGDYAPILTLDDLRLLRDALAQAKWFSIDTETCNSTDWRVNELITVQFCPEPDTGFIVPILFKATEDEVDSTGKVVGPGTPNESLIAGHLARAWTPEEWPQMIEIMGEILGSDVSKGFHFGMYDLPELERDAASECVESLTAFGWYVNNYNIDTCLLARALDETLSNDLDALTARETDLPYYSGEVQELSARKRHMEWVPNEVLWKYGGADVDVTRSAEAGIRERIEHANSAWLVDNVSVPIVRCAWEMQRRGVLVDLDYFDELCEIYRTRIASREIDLFSAAGDTFKYKDYKAIQRILFDELKLPHAVGRTKGGRDCAECKEMSKGESCDTHSPTGGAALKEIYTLTEHPILPPLIDLKKWNKFHSTYLDGGRGGFRRWICRCGRVHPKWKPSGTETGRFSCEDPNLMNMPKLVEVQEGEVNEHSALRRMFIAPEGGGLINADWNQLEVWGLAYETGDQTLLGLLEAGEDVHTYVARRMCEMHVNEEFFPDLDRDLDNFAWRALHEEIRRRAKVFVFGLSYGMTEEGVSVRLGCSTEQAALLIEAFLRIFPTLRRYFARIRHEIMEFHKIRNWAYRWRHFPEAAPLMALGFRNDLESAFREGINFPVQSGGHDLHASAHIRTEFSDAIRSRASIVMEVHDSLTLEGSWPDNDYMIQTAWMIKELWENTARNLITPDGKRLGWKVPVEIDWGTSYGTSQWKLNARGEVKAVEAEAA